MEVGNIDEYEKLISKRAEHEESANRVRFFSGMSFVLVDVRFPASNEPHLPRANWASGTVRGPAKAI
jgi:hypothetical protein